MNPQLPCRWEDRPQAWATVLARGRWFDRHARRLGWDLAGPLVVAAREHALEAAWAVEVQP